MAKATKKQGLIALLSCAVLFSGYFTALAASIISYTPTTGSNVSLSASEYRGQKFHINGSVEITGFTFKATNGTTNVARSWTLSLYDAAGTQVATRAITNTQVGAHSAGTDITLSFSSAAAVTSGDYFIGILYVSGEGVTMSMESPGNYGFGCKLAYSGTGALGSCGTDDLYFKVEGNLGTVSIAFPSDATSLRGDFNSWLLNYSAPSGDTTFVVHYGTSSTALSASSSIGLSLANGTYGQNILVPKTDALSVGSYYWAQANVVQSGSNIATSTMINFQVAGNSTIDSFAQFTPTAPTSTSTDLTVTCDPNSSYFANSFCKLFQYLFVPDPAVWDNFKTLQNDLSNKPPFGYVSSVSSALGGLVSSSTPSTTGFNVLSGVSTLFTDLKTMLSWALWLIFGFWVFNKFRHFKS